MDYVHSKSCGYANDTNFGFDLIGSVDLSQLILSVDLHAKLTEQMRRHCLLGAK